MRHDRRIISSGIIALTFVTASQTAFAYCEPASYSVGSNGKVASGGGSFSRQACQEMNGGRGRIEYRFEHGHSVLIADRIPSIHFVDTPSAPLFNKTSGLNIKTAAAAGTNVSGWFETRPDQSGKVGYYLNDITYNNYSDFTVNFTFKENWGQISRTGITSPDGLQIYRINSQPWLGVSFQLATRVDGGNIGRWQAQGRRSTFEQNCTNWTSRKVLLFPRKSVWAKSYQPNALRLRISAFNRPTDSPLLTNFMIIPV